MAAKKISKKKPAKKKRTPNLRRARTARKLEADLWSLFVFSSLAGGKKAKDATVEADYCVLVYAKQYGF